MALTKTERSALAWLLGVAAVGTAARLWQNWRNSGAVTPLAAEALSLQLLAVDSAQRADRRARPARRGSPRGRSSSTAADSAPAAGRRGRRRDVGDSTSRITRQLPRLDPVDVDRADAVALDRLPRIGPALAARIVDDRHANGPFGSLEALQRVRGIGPRLAEGLKPYVTFSANPRPSPVQR